MARDSFATILDVQKARMTVQLALFAAAISLTVAAFRGNPYLCLVAAGIVPLALLIDLITKYKYMAPLLYLQALQDLRDGLHVSNALLFIAYEEENLSKYRRILAQEETDQQRMAFRRFYVCRHLAFKLLFFAVLFVAEIILYFKIPQWVS